MVGVSETTLDLRYNIFMMKDGASHHIDARLPVEQALEKKRERMGNAKRFLKDPQFRNELIKQLQKRAGRKSLSSSLRRKDSGTDTNPVRPDGELLGQVGGGAEPQAIDKSAVGEGMIGVPETERVRAGLAGTIRLRQTGMLPPPAERNRNADEVIAQGEAKHEEAKKRATGILVQRMETARLAEEQERQGRILTFPERDADDRKQG